MAIKSIKIETLISRVVLVAAGLVFLIFASYCARWYLANSIAAHTQFKDVADFAADLAPGDPQTHYTLGVLAGRVFTPQDLARSLSEFEQSVALSPNDFRVWLALGRAREQSGDQAGAELALRKAVELAPNYSQVRWSLGNILLRRGRTNEAFTEIRRAAESDPAFVNPAIVTAWQISDGNLAQIKQNIGDSQQINVALISFLSREKRFDEALEIWNALPDDGKKTTLREIGEQFYRQMLEAKKYREAFRIRSQITASDAERATIGQIANGGFEWDVKTKDAGVFEWQIADGVKPQVGFDNTQKRGGNRSLGIIFNSPDGRDFRGITQTVAVEPEKKYKFEAFYKADLKTIATLYWEIADASDGKVLAKTAAASPNADWTNLRADFNSSNAEAVTVRLAREACKSAVCPISGKIWFDDFSISQ